jgi:hypothetical protein
MFFGGLYSSRKAARTGDSRGGKRLQSQAIHVLCGMSIGRVYRAIGVAFFEVEIQLLQSGILPTLSLAARVCLPATC